MSRSKGAFVTVVVIPLLFAALYYGLFASDIYVSEARFTVRSHGGSGVSTGLLTGLIGTVDSSVAAQDVAVVSDYIRSRDLLEHLDAKLGLRRHFQGTSVDRLSRLADDATEEEFLEYYQDKIETLKDEASGIVTLKTKAFTPELAKIIAEEILVQSEGLVNDMSDQITEDSVQFARDELARAEGRLQEATVALTRFRNLTNTVDPAEKSGAVLGIITDLESRLAGARTELSEMRGYLQEGSAQVVSVKNRINALETQIEQENRRLTGEEKAKLSSLLQEYETLNLDKQIAHEFYTSTLASLENARVEAMRKQLYLVTFVKPALADEALEPRRAWNTLTVFILSLLVYIIGGLVFATIKDHMGVD